MPTFSTQTYKLIPTLVTRAHNVADAADHPTQTAADATDATAADAAATADAGVTPTALVVAYVST